MSVKPTPRDFTDSYGTLEGAISPVPKECADWIEAMTPLGSPALRCQPYGVHYAFQECVLPLTNPRVFARPPAIGEPSDWLRRVLGAVHWNAKPLKPEQVGKLALMLAPGPRRLDGLPAYWPAAPNVHQTQAWAALRERLGAPARALLAAAACDLQGLPLEHISGALLDLRDHEVPYGSEVIAGDPRRARGLVSQGRELWGAIGVWPWTHTDRGRLPHDWRREAAFLEPLRVWHESAVAEREEECRFARAVFASPVYD